MLYYNTNLEFIGATLLSDKEAINLTLKESKYKFHWWLRNQGGDIHYAGYVNKSGLVDCGGYLIGENNSIRPALIISNLGEFKVGDIFSIGKYYFKIISPTRAWLYKQDIGRDYFDDKSNDYETSHVKKVVEAWYKTLREEMR